MKVHFSLSIFIPLLFVLSCKKELSIQKTITKPSFNYKNLIKDTVLFKVIAETKTNTTYTFRDSSLTIFKKDSLMWSQIFHCPTPSQTFWNKNRLCDQLDDSLSPSLNLPLRGFRVALDAGHLAGTPLMAEIEGKKIKLKHPNTKDSVFFYEGELTFLTVTLLKDSLTRLGAQVFTTRKSNESALGYTYFEWLDQHFLNDIDSCLQYHIITKEDYNLLLSEKEKNTLLSKKIIFHKLFKHLDFHERATIINQFQPDITVIVHYNVDVKNKRWEKPTKSNFNMAFVPGAFMNGELKTHIDFNNFIRLNTTNEISESIMLSSYILKGLKKHTNVDIIHDYSDISYLNDYCLPTNQRGVFSRNLALTRQIKGPLCYIEALYQDNFEESLLLNKKETNNYSPRRVKHVAIGALEGIIEYLLKNDHR
jgi:N-acetylmuramoyl-L-alanine amidase